MHIDIAGKVVVVTGAAQGIGRTLALGLAAEGARVAVLARDRRRAQLVVDEIAAFSEAPPALALEADVGDEAAVMGAAAEVDLAWGRVDALINNAGWMPGRHPILEMKIPVLERVLRSDLVGSFVTTKHFAPLMIRGGGGRIIYMSSGAGAQSGPGGAAYGGSKAAMNILANVAHQEFADAGIRTIALAPSLTDTPGMQDIVTEAHAGRHRRVMRVPVQRCGQPSLRHRDHRAPAGRKLSRAASCNDQITGRALAEPRRPVTLQDRKPEEAMRRLSLAIIAIGFAMTATASAAPCRNDKGKFVTCPPAAAAAKKCRDAKGKFIKCQAMPAAPS